MGRSQIWNFHPIQVKMYQFFISNLGIILPVYYRCYKLASSVNLYRFTYLRRFPQRRNFRKLLVGGSIPNPLWTPPAVSAAHSFWILLLTDFCAICIEVQFSINEKMKTWEKFPLIIYVMYGNPLPNNLSGSLVGNSPTSNKSANGWIQLHPNLGWTTSCQLGTKLKIKETEKRKSLRHNLCRSWRAELYACGRIGQTTVLLFSENQLCPKLGWSATV